LFNIKEKIKQFIGENNALIWLSDSKLYRQKSE
jgi:hypothetical protein